MQADDKDWKPFSLALRDIMYGIRSYMDLYEREVLFFIYSRTALFGKLWEYIPIRHFEQGVYQSDEALICAPVAMTKRKLLESLEHLENKGIISIEREGRATNRYKVNEITDVISDSHMQSYLRRNQPSLYRSLYSKAQNQADKIATLKAQALVRLRTNGRGAYTPTDGAQTHQPNIPIINNHISKVAVRSAPSGTLRKLTLRKGA